MEPYMLLVYVSIYIEIRELFMVVLIYYLQNERFLMSGLLSIKYNLYRRNPHIN